MTQQCNDLRPDPDAQASPLNILDRSFPVCALAHATQGVGRIEQQIPCAGKRQENSRVPVNHSTLIKIKLCALSAVVAIASTTSCGFASEQTVAPLKGMLIV